MPAKAGDYDAISGSYTLQGQIGQGCFATVHSAQHVETGVNVAIKIIDKQRCTNMNLMRNEINALRAVSHHPYVVDVYEVTEDSKYIYIVMEYCSNGNLHDYLVANGPMSEDRAKLWFSQLVCAVEYCHRAGVLNGDIKNANVLIDVLGNVKISDFGLSSLVDNVYTTRVTRATGSAVFAAPEVYMAHKGIPYLGPAAEVWALGGVLHSMLTATLPFRIETYQSSWMTYRPPPKRSPECQSLLERIFEYVPGKRPTTSEILSHEWVTLPLTREFSPVFPSDHHAVYHNNALLHSMRNPHHYVDNYQYNHRYSQGHHHQSASGYHMPPQQRGHQHPMGYHAPKVSLQVIGGGNTSPHFEAIITSPPTNRNNANRYPVAMDTMPSSNNSTRLWERVFCTHTEVFRDVESKLDQILEIMGSMGRPAIELDTVRLMRSEGCRFDTGVDAYTTFLLLVAAARNVLLETRAQSAASWNASGANFSAYAPHHQFHHHTLSTQYEYTDSTGTANTGYHGNSHSRLTVPGKERRRHSTSVGHHEDSRHVTADEVPNGARRSSRGSRPRAPTCSSQELAAFPVLDSRGGSTAMQWATAA